MNLTQLKRIYGGSTEKPKTPRDQERAKLAGDVEQFLANGGVIEQCEIRVGEVEKKQARGAHVRGKAKKDFTINQEKKNQREAAKRKPYENREQANGRKPGRSYDAATPEARRWNGSTDPQ